MISSIKNNPGNNKVQNISFSGIHGLKLPKAYRENGIKTQEDFFAYFTDPMNNDGKLINIAKKFKKFVEQLTSQADKEIAAIEPKIYDIDGETVLARFTGTDAKKLPHLKNSPEKAIKMIKEKGVMYDVNKEFDTMSIIACEDQNLNQLFEKTPFSSI